MNDKKNYEDKYAFSFSLNNNKKYKILVPEYAFGINKTNLIFIGNNSNQNGFFHTTQKNKIYDMNLINYKKIYDFSKNNELTNGDDQFMELEIFEIDSK